MRRRQYLATSAALLAGPLAGCAHPNAVLTMEAVSDQSLAERASRNVSEHPEGSDIVAEAVTNGSANASGRSPPLDTDGPIEYQGRYYELTATEVGEREEIQYVLEVAYGPADETVGGEAIEYDDLPEVDRDALEQLLPPPEDTAEGRERVERLYTETEAESSVLVPEPQYDAVVYDGERYRVDAGRRTTTEHDYRYEADEIAADAAEFAESLRSAYLFTLSGLSDAERDVVSEAIDEGYYEGSADDAFTSVARRFREHRGIDTDEWGGNWLVRYEGTDYWADLRHPPSAVEE